MTRTDWGILFLLLMLCGIFIAGIARGGENKLIAKRIILATDNLNADLEAAFLSAEEELRTQGCAKVDAVVFVDIEKPEKILLVVVCVELAPQE